MYSIATSETTCWIGLNDIDTEETFTWADGSNSTYRRWSSGQPNNYDNNEDVTVAISYPLDTHSIVSNELEKSQTVPIVQVYSSCQ